MTKDFIQIIRDRGFLHQMTDEDGLRTLLKTPGQTAYIGFDCTAKSLHVGSLLQIMLLRWWQKCGHTPIVLLGGGTTKIGDPSGKDESRPKLDDAAIAENMASLKNVFAKFIDFDGDGYAEPYIVWVRRDTKQVLRIVARYFEQSIERNPKGKILGIKAEQYFTKFPFIPSPDGGFYDLGFGVLLGPLNQSIDTLINQMIDAGTMANTAGGFLSRGIKMRGGNYNFAPLEWKHVDSTGDDLRKGIVPLPVREPSQVLFTLLGMLINYGERIGGSVDILVGQNPGQNTAAETTRTMAEQGMKIFSGIFKRTYRSLKQEFRKIYRLNQLYLDDEVDFQSDKGEFNISADDYNGPVSDISPSADPNIVSDSQLMAKAQAMLQLATTTPGVNIRAAQLMYAKAWKVAELENLLPDPKGPNAIKPAVPEKLQVEQMKAQIKQADLQLQMKLGVLKLMDTAKLNEAKIHKLEAEALLALETAGGVRTGQEIQLINSQISAMKAKNEGIMSSIELMMKLTEGEDTPSEPTGE